MFPAPDKLDVAVAVLGVALAGAADRSRAAEPPAPYGPVPTPLPCKTIVP